MNNAQAATAKVASELAMENYIRRGVEASEKYRAWRSEDAKVGQAWTLRLPIPLWDTIDEEHRLPPVRPVFFIMDMASPNDKDADTRPTNDGCYEPLLEDWLYGFLCLGTRVTSPLPVLKRELKRWEHAPYAWSIDILMLDGGPVAPTADFVMTLYPNYVKKRWLTECQADFGSGSEKRVWDKSMAHFSSGAPGILEEHSRNKVGGHTLKEISQHIKDCWHHK